MNYGPLEETEDDDLPSSPASSSTSSTWLGNVTLAWQEKLFSPCEENYYRRAKEEDFQGKASQENRSNQVCKKYMFLELISNSLKDYLQQDIKIL